MSEQGPTGPTIHCGKSFHPIGGELITAGQCFDCLGRLLLMETDADDETLLRVLDTAQFIETLLRQRISGEQPATTAAERHH
jgi:hypothetical protein